MRVIKVNVKIDGAELEHINKEERPNRNKIIVVSDGGRTCALIGGKYYRGLETLTFRADGINADLQTEPSLFKCDYYSEDKFFKDSADILGYKLTSER